MRTLDEILQESAVGHRHLCPRQILGVRMALYASGLLDRGLPRKDKRLLIISEMDGCFVDGISAATGCTVGHRTLRIEDYGKVAATFVDTETGQAVRMAPAPDIRQKSQSYSPGESRHYFAQMRAYREIPDEELLVFQEVVLNVPVKAIVSRAGVRVNCGMCGEEIMNEREILRNGIALCRACAHGGYFHPAMSCAFKISYTSLMEHDKI